jgi:hypothetical protein
MPGSKIINGVEYVGFPEDVLAKISGLDTTSKSISPRAAATMAMVDAQTAALEIRIDRQVTELKLRDAEQRLRIATLNREMGKVQAHSAREQVTRDAADGKLTTEQRLVISANAQRALFRARDRSEPVEKSTTDSPPLQRTLKLLRNES